MLIFDKMMKFSILNSSPHSEGKITNYLNTDIESIGELSDCVMDVVKDTITFILSFSFCYYLFSWVLFSYAGVYLIIIGVNALLYRVYIKYREQLISKRDSTISILKNCLKNIKFIKMMSWENVYFKRICDKRNQELKIIWKQQILYLFWQLSDSMAPILAYLSFIGTVLALGKFWSLAQIQAFTNNVDNLIATLQDVPLTLQHFTSINVSIKRVQKF